MIAVRPYGDAAHDPPNYRCPFRPSCTVSTLVSRRTDDLAYRDKPYVPSAPRCGGPLTLGMSWRPELLDEAVTVTEPASRAGDGRLAT